MKYYLIKKFIIILFIFIISFISFVYTSTIVYKAYCVDFNIYSIGQGPFSSVLLIFFQIFSDIFNILKNIFFLQQSLVELLPILSTFLIIPQSTLFFNSSDDTLLLECSSLTSNFIAYSGDILLIDFKVTNHSSKVIDFNANFTNTPVAMSIFLQKIQCFCYSKIRLEPFASLNLPVLLYISPELSFEFTKKLPETSRIIKLNYIFYISR